MDFTGKVVVVTGASSGIGASTAEHFASLGASLVITGRNEENLKKVADKCAGKAFMVIGDLINDEDRVKIIEKTIEKFGKIDVLVNNAGIVGYGGIKETSMEQFDSIIGINLRSVYHLTILATPHLIKTKGNIVNVSSICGMRAFSGKNINFCLGFRKIVIKYIIFRKTRLCHFEIWLGSIHAVLSA